MRAQSTFRREDGAFPNVLALSYTVFGNALGLVLLTQPNFVLVVMGWLLVAHTLVFSAYFIHEFVHGSIFRRAQHARIMGELFLWMNDSYFVTFKDVQRTHLDHHAKRADIFQFDFRRFFRAHPWCLRCIQALEWACIPIFDVFMRVEVAFRKFRNNDEGVYRRRVLFCFAARLVVFGAMARASWWALGFYGIAYMFFLHVLRFLDAHQHTYDTYWFDANGNCPVPLPRDADYEDQNTYSNVLSARYPWLSLLVLNFPYHNAHHAVPREPWYRLPTIHIELYGDLANRVVSARKLITSYWRHRVTRIMSDEYGALTANGQPGDDFIGAIGVSFLY